jgi:flavin reductase (DIM6/NTAB) family NADH-FMN oxidoreductase RutF
VTVTERLEEAALRHAFGRFPSGVAAVCGLSGGTPLGMAVSSFTSVSVNPPLVSACVQNTSTTWPRLQRLPRLGVSVLAEGQQHAGRSLAMKAGDRFAGVGWRADTRGAVFVEDSAAWFDCSVYAEVAAGDHTLVLLRIHALDTAESAPLVFHDSRFRRLNLADETDGP